MRINFHDFITFDNQIYNMETFRRLAKKPKVYSKISLKERMELVEFVLESGMSIIKASKKLKIKPSTAKLILKRYIQEGTFFEKRSQRIERAKREKLLMEQALQNQSKNNYNVLQDIQESHEILVASEPLALNNNEQYPYLYGGNAVQSNIYLGGISNWAASMQYCSLPFYYRYNYL